MARQTLQLVKVHIELLRQGFQVIPRRDVLTLLEELQKRFSYKAIPCRPWRAGFFL